MAICTDCGEVYAFVATSDQKLWLPVCTWSLPQGMPVQVMALLPTTFYISAEIHTCANSFMLTGHLGTSGVRWTARRSSGYGHSDALGGAHGSRRQRDHAAPCLAGGQAVMRDGVCATASWPAAGCRRQRRMHQVPTWRATTFQAPAELWDMQPDVSSHLAGCGRRNLERLARSGCSSLSLRQAPVPAAPFAGEALARVCPPCCWLALGRVLRWGIMICRQAFAYLLVDRAFATSMLIEK